MFGLQSCSTGRGLTADYSISWEEDAEARCELLITEALLIRPDASEVLQTLASIRISQLRIEDARAALSRSIGSWQHLSPEDPGVPDFALRISLSRLLMEVSMQREAHGILERLVLEDDQSVEAWYLLGWCSYLMAETVLSQMPPDQREDGRREYLMASRGCLKMSLKLYDLLQYEDERLRDHAVELVQEMNKELGEDTNDDSEAEGEEDDGWEDEEIEADSDEDDEMADS